MLPLPCMLVCIFVCANRTRDRGCSKHPVFPAPSNFEEGKRRCKPRADYAARMRNCIHRHCERSEAIHVPAQRKEAKQSMCRHKERMDCFAALAMTWTIRSPDERSDIRECCQHCPRISLRSSGLVWGCGCQGE